jgi:hypothetical protein
MGTYIGGTLSVSASTPATEDEAGYDALSWTEIGNVLSIGELGATTGVISVNPIKTGVTKHYNGMKDLGEIPIAVEFDASDAGMTILEAGNNGSTVHSFKVADADGRELFWQGLIANLRDTARDGETHRGKTFVIRAQTDLTEVDAS